MSGNKAKLIKQSVMVERSHRTYSYLRTATFSGEFTLLQAFMRLFKPIGEIPEVKQDPALRPFIQQDIAQLFHSDATLFQDNICPLSVALPESPLGHLRRFGKILLAGVGMSRLRKLRQTKISTPHEELPAYYQRHYHWQQGGYLTESSAQLYDHQVEILFKGTAAAMRRLIMRPLAQFLATSSVPCQILEVGAGTGLAAREVHLSFPFHHLTVSDLSAPYLGLARDRLSGRGVKFTRAAAEELPFPDGVFDVVYSTFMFHELPRDVRERALKEFYRVLRPGGLVLVVDSIQESDVPEYEQALESFPRDYHEPFFRDYCRWPIDDALKRHGFASLGQERGFFAKRVSGIKPRA